MVIGGPILIGRSIRRRSNEGGARLMKGKFFAVYYVILSDFCSLNVIKIVYFCLWNLEVCLSI